MNTSTSPIMNTDVYSRIGVSPYTRIYIAILDSADPISTSVSAASSTTAPFITGRAACCVRSAKQTSARLMHAAAASSKNPRRAYSE